MFKDSLVSAQFSGSKIKTSVLRFQSTVKISMCATRLKTIYKILKDLGQRKTVL